MKKKLLLHICCSPCVVYVWEKLNPDFDISGFFYNPNIHPCREYEFRKNELTRIAKKFNWKIIYPPYDMMEWFKIIRGYEREPERGKRCSICFYMRLKKTFEHAKNNQFDIVASTLSISPYKDTKQINKAGYQLSESLEIPFLPEDFKKKDGANKWKKLSLKLGIKHQNYCGCVYSKVEKKMRKN